MTKDLEVVAAISRCGGISDAKTLIRLTSRTRLENATKRGLVVKDARGRYALPTAELGLRTANQLTAVMSHTSAAAHWGWEMKVVPPRPTVTVPRKRRIPAGVRTEVEVFWRALDAGPLRPGQVTPPLQTVIDCARWLKFDEALAIADSALRHRSVTPESLDAARSTIRGRGRPAVLRVLGAADGRSDNPSSQHCAPSHWTCQACISFHRWRSEDGDAGWSDRTSSTRCCGLSLRPTASSTTVRARLSPSTVPAMTTSWPTAGRCCGSPGSR